MKRLHTVIGNKMVGLLVLALLAGFMTSCNSVLDFDKGDCTYQYKIKFKYDYNMKYADAFHSLVSTVTLYAFDENGNYVYQKTDNGDQLKDENYAMSVDLAPGKYHFVTWAGLNNQSFAIPVFTSSSQKLTDCKVKTRRTSTTRTMGQEGDNIVDQELFSLWHGEIAEADVEAEAHTRARDTILTVPLIKNTNTVRIVIVQAASDAEVKASTRAIGTNSFKYTLCDDNGYMNYDNTLLSDSLLTYKPYLLADSTLSTRSGDNTAKALKSVATGDAQDTYKAVVAEISTARLLTTQNPQLKITNLDGSVSLLPSNSLKQYLLLLKEAKYASMDFQEYLDREDHFDMIFFVDKSLTLMKTLVVINDWIVNLNNIDL
jgi:hypothetical protein